MESSLTLLKQRLLLEKLDEVPDTELHARVIYEAALAAEASANTPFPHLIFPCLFEERVVASLQLEARRRQSYWRPLIPLSANSRQSFSA
jgi:hypothetical protein